MEGFDKTILERQMKAEIASRKFLSKLKLADPQDLMHLYKPMEFNVLKRGRFSIEPQVTKSAPIVNMRNAFLLGIRPVQLNFSAPVTFHKLIEKDKGCLTTDTPNEIYTQYISFHYMHGHVLVGGLGLGMAAEMILNLPNVKTVTVVEKDKVIINLIKPQISPRINIVHADLFKFLKNKHWHRSAPYDSAYYDIWYRTREETWGESVVPLYRLSRVAGINTLGAWCEYDMWGQLYPGLHVRAGIPLSMSSMRFKPHGVFLKAAKKLKVTDKQLPKFLKLYLTQVGTEEWEQTFDWGGK